MYILLNAKDLLIVISFRNISVLFVSSTAIWAIITTMNTITSPCKSPATPPRSEFSCPISGSLFITDVAFINIERIINIRMNRTTNIIVLSGTSTTGFATLSRTALPGLPDDCTTLTTTLFIVPLSMSSIVLPLRSRAGTVSPTLSIISFSYARRRKIFIHSSI